MEINHIELQSQNFKTQYAIETASIWYEHGRFAINIEGEENDDDGAEGDEGDPFYSLGPPIINFHWASSSRLLSELVGTTVLLEKAYDETLEDHVSTLYLSGHYELNDIVVSFREATESKVIATVTGKTDPEETDVAIKVSVDVSLELSDR